MSWKPKDPRAADLLADLRALAKDRPAHLRFIDQCEALIVPALESKRDIGAIWADLDDLPRPSGVSKRVADTITDDLSWIMDLEVEPDKTGRSVYGAAYRQRRRNDANAASERERNRGSLGGMFKL